MQEHGERRALEQDPKARARWIATEWPRIKRLARKQRALLFFEDESVVRLTATAGRTWAPVGKSPIGSRYGQKRASVLVMSALSMQGRLFFKIPSEKVNATVFIEFLKELLAEYPSRKIFVIADQASPHIAKKGFRRRSEKARVVLPAGILAGFQSGWRFGVI